MKYLNRTRLLTILAVPVLIGGASLGGCETMNGNRDTDPMAQQEPTISLAASNRQIVSGEIATFSASSENVLGRDAQVEWITTGGDIRPQDNGRIARAMFNQPGAYTVTAMLIVDGREVDRDSVTVNVRPLR